jgi:hypothetical protein
MNVADEAIRRSLPASVREDELELGFRERSGESLAPRV